MIEIGLIGAIILAADIYAIWCILNEPWDGVKKVFWILLVIVFQVFGMLAYFAFFRTSSSKQLPPPK